MHGRATGELEEGREGRKGSWHGEYVREKQGTADSDRNGPGIGQCTIACSRERRALGARRSRKSERRTTDKSERERRLGQNMISLSHSMQPHERSPPPLCSPLRRAADHARARALERLTPWPHSGLCVRALRACSQMQAQARAGATVQARGAQRSASSASSAGAASAASAAWPARRTCAVRAPCNGSPCRSPVAGRRRGRREQRGRGRYDAGRRSQTQQDEIMAGGPRQFARPPPDARRPRAEGRGVGSPARHRPLPGSLHPGPAPAPAARCQSWSRRQLHARSSSLAARSSQLAASLGPGAGRGALLTDRRLRHAPCARRARCGATCGRAGAWHHTPAPAAYRLHEPRSSIFDPTYRRRARTCTRAGAGAGAQPAQHWDDSADGSLALHTVLSRSQTDCTHARTHAPSREGIASLSPRQHAPGAGWVTTDSLFPRAPRGRRRHFPRSFASRISRIARDRRRPPPPPAARRTRARAR